jgi:chromosome segregation ATPase
MSLQAGIPVELMEILNRINDNINEVKERITRIEAQDHSVSIRSLQAEIDKERDERIKLQVQLENVKTRLTPIVAVVSLVGAGVVNLIVNIIHH